MKICLETQVCSLPPNAGASVLDTESVPSRFRGHFDWGSAEFDKEIDVGLHWVYRDAFGNICMQCNSSLSRGAVAVHEFTLSAFSKLPGAKFIRLTNRGSRFDITCRLDELPKGRSIETEIGPDRLYFIMDFACTQ